MVSQWSYTIIYSTYDRYANSEIEMFAKEAPERSLLVFISKYFRFYTINFGTLYKSPKFIHLSELKTLYFYYNTSNN